MIKVIKQLCMHLLIVAFKGLFRILCKHLDIAYDDQDVPFWYDEKCGIEECIFD